MLNHEDSQSQRTDVRIQNKAAPATECCQACHIAKNSGAKFCPECGRELSAENHTHRQPAEPRSDPTLPMFQTEDPTSPQKNLPEQESSEPVVPVIPKPREQEDNKTLMCRRCGQYLNTKSQFCHHCGEPVKGAESQSRLICIDKGSFAKVAEITDKAITLGKAPDCDLVLSDDNYVSRHHARIIPNGQSFLLEDLNSSNGTYLKIRGQITVKGGDEFLIGTHVIRFEQIQGG